MACGQGGLEPAQERVGPTRGQCWHFPGAQPPGGLHARPVTSHDDAAQMFCEHPTWLRWPATRWG